MLQAPPWHTLSLHPSRPSPSCALMWVTSPPEPQSLVSRGKRHTCSMGCNTFHPTRALRTTSSRKPPSQPRGVSHTLLPATIRGLSVCPSAHHVCLSLPLAMTLLAPSSLQVWTGPPLTLEEPDVALGGPRRLRPQGWAAPASAERPVQGERSCSQPPRERQPHGLPWKKKSSADGGGRVKRRRGRHPVGRPAGV